jgi:general secretion pathway protein G
MSKKLARQRGFTLVELMVVIVILGGLIALVGPRVFRAIFKASTGTAEAQMSSFGNAIKMYYAEHKKLPTSLEALVEEDASGERYLDAESIPKDPWGGVYDYRVSGKKFTIRSYGEDQQEGTADDIVWPKDGAQDD